MRFLAAAVAMVLCRGAAAESRMYGQISSPGYPGPYPEDTEREWTVTVPKGYRVQLHFTHFDLEPSQKCIYDAVEVMSEARHLGKFCGNRNNVLGNFPGSQLLTSRGNSMDLRFTSDFSNEGLFLGFVAHYQAIDIDECLEESADSPLCEHICHNTLGGYFCSCWHGYQLQNDGKTCEVRCEEFYSEISGTIRSPEYPKAYPPNMRCNYSIRIEKGFSIGIEFADLFEIDSHDVVPCPYDELTIESRNKVMGPFCGTERPDPIETRSNMVNIYFKTDGSGISRGWSLQYTTDRIQCPDLPPLEHGSIRPAQKEYRFLDGVVFMCDTGYKIMKANTELKSFSTVCTGDGEWDKDFFPVCQVIDCGDPEELENGDFQLTQGSSALNGYLSEIRYSCEKRYSMESEGDGTYTCTDSRHWLNTAVSERIPYCAPVCGKPDHPPHQDHQRIFGGVLAKEGNFPWQVLLQSNSFGLAGGILISDQWVLTAAHIFWPKRHSKMTTEQLKDFRIYLGGLSLRGTQKMRINVSADKYYLHNGYSGDTAQFHNDIALVKLAQRVKMTGGIMPACLPASAAPNLYRPRSLGYVAGWGITENYTLLDELRYVRLPLVRVGECTRAMERAQEQQGTNPRERMQVWGTGMMCAGTGLGGQDSCQGDSGGAFAVRDQAEDRWYAIGVVSWGLGCGQVGTYGVYTKVSHYRDWIDQVMATG